MIGVRRVDMAIVHCRACKQKITRMDTTCPRCGAPNSRLMPFFLGFILLTLCAVFYNVLSKKSAGSDQMDVVVTPSSKANINRSGTTVAGTPEAD